MSDVVYYKCERNIGPAVQHAVFNDDVANDLSEPEVFHAVTRTGTAGMEKEFFLDRIRPVQPDDIFNKQ